MKKILLSSLCIASLTICANAADIPAKGPLTVAAVPVYNWTGYYIGANAGYGVGTSSWTDTDYDWFGSTLGLHRNSATAGAQIGYNQQVGRFVYGLEADLNWAGFGKNTNYNCNGQICGSDGYDVLIEDKWSWFGTLRGRAGLAADNVLVYFTGGIAVGNVTHTWTEVNDPTDSWPKFGGTKAGVAVGVGAEWGFAPQWTAKAEALYLDLGVSKSTNQDGYEMEVRDGIFLARLGLNYRPDGNAATRAVSAPAAPFSWSGFYIGANAGYGIGTTAWSDPDFAENGGTLDLEKQSLVAGVQLGSNYQTGRLVYGVEADWNFANFGRDLGTACREGVNCDNDVRNDWTWFATARGRVGLAVDNVLAYVTAGPAIGNVKHTWLDSNTASDNHEQFGGTKLGVAVGGGVEWAIASQWTAKAEYLYIDLGKSSDTNPENVKVTVRDTASIVRLGLNYRPGGQIAAGPAQVAGPYAWSGFYVGANAGYGRGNSAWTDSDYDWFGGSLDNQRDSFTGGIQAGYNYQAGRFVYGVETDINWADFGSKINYACSFPCGSNGHDVLMENDWNWFGTFRGRAGVAVENVLAYVTGGLAVGNVGHTWTESGDPQDNWSKFGGTKAGVVVGGGIEWGVTPQWTAKAEGLYIDLGDSSATSEKGFTMHVRDTAYVARLGLNYRPF